MDLDYPELSKVNPRVVLAHVSGFGQYGPYRDRLAFDRIATAFAGQDYIAGFPDNPLFDRPEPWPMISQDCSARSE